MSNVIVQVGPLEHGSTAPLVKAVLGGLIEKSDVELISAWAEGLVKAVREAAEGGRSVDVLIDISKLETYTDARVVTILSDSIKDNTGKIRRIATWGGNSLHEMAEQVIESLAGRYDIRNFKTEAEALAWLAET